MYALQFTIGCSAVLIMVSLSGLIITVIVQLIRGRLMILPIPDGPTLIPPTSGKADTDQKTTTNEVTSGDVLVTTFEVTRKVSRG